MSVFQVNLNNQYQGYLDIDPQTGIEFEVDYNNPSIQRKMYVAGPNGESLEFSDGQIFTDCNYWKRFAYPQVPLTQAFITVLSDDGSIYSNNPAENNYPVVYSETLAAAGSYSIDFSSNGGFASFCQISNTGGGDLSVELNGLPSATINVAAGSTQIFNYGDLSLTALNLSSVAGTTFQVVAGVQVTCNVSFTSLVGN